MSDLNKMFETILWYNLRSSFEHNLNDSFWSSFGLGDNIRSNFQSSLLHSLDQTAQSAQNLQNVKKMNDA